MRNKVKRLGAHQDEPQARRDDRERERLRGCHIVGRTPASFGMATHADLPACHQLVGNSPGAPSGRVTDADVTPRCEVRHLLHPRRRSLLRNRARDVTGSRTDGITRVTKLSWLTEQWCPHSFRSSAGDSAEPHPCCSPSNPAFPRPGEEGTTLRLTARGHVVP